jgi:hypothetical protein
MTPCGACHDTHEEPVVEPHEESHEEPIVEPHEEWYEEPGAEPPELEYPVTDSLVIEVQPPPPPSPLELLQALIPHLVSTVLLIGLILYIGRAVLKAIEGTRGGQGA